MRKILVDKHISEFTEVETSKRSGVLATIKGAVTGWEPNRNGRTYSRELWEKALNSDYVKEQVALKHFVGEADHPEERLEPIIKEMSHSMTDFEFHDDTREVWATIDILDTPNGHMLKTLLDYSGSLSFSTRGSGDVMENGEVDPDTYQLFAIDAVLRPSYPTATVSLTESVNIKKSDRAVKNLIEKYSGSGLKEWYGSPRDGVIKRFFLGKNIEGQVEKEDDHYILYIRDDLSTIDWAEIPEEWNKLSSDEYESKLRELAHKLLNDEDDYLESTMFKLNHPKLKENFGDTKDYSIDIEKLYKKWFRQNADLGIRFFNLMSLFDIDVEEKGEDSNRCYEYTMVVNAPFVDTQDWKEEIGCYIADHIPSITFEETYEIDDRESEDHENIIWIFRQQIGIPDFGKDFE